MERILDNDDVREETEQLLLRAEHGAEQIEGTRIQFIIELIHRLAEQVEDLETKIQHMEGRNNGV